MPRWVPRTSSANVAFVALGVFVLLLPTSVAASSGAPSSGKPISTDYASARASGAGAVVYRLPPGLHLGIAPFRTPSRPAQSDLYYLQSGSTISSLNESSATGVARLSEYIPLVNSPYSTAYELNGLTNSGDWWQIVIADNWPGCNSGFEEATEVWDNAQNSGPITCDSTVSLSAGDVVELTIYFSSGGNGCMTLKDVTTAVSHTLCDAQPNSGGTKWEFLSTASDSNGYYTGTMTEVVNSTATSCPDYLYMPTVEYEFANGTYVTDYIPWSDEFDLFQSNGSRALCYASSNGTESIGPGDPASQYVNTASGTSYGPRWADGENYSLQNPAYGFRYETDPTRLTSVSLSGGPSTPTAGTLVNFTTNVTGGVGPYSTIWRVNGVISGTGNLTWSWRAGLAGPYKFDDFAVDVHGDVIGPSNAVDITVPGPLAIGGVRTTPAAGTDQGLAVSIIAEVSGGFGYWVFNWTGLPVGCPAANASTINCFPNVTGSSNISVTVRDANGSVVSAGPHPFQVYATLDVQIVANTTALDVGQSVSFTARITGGSGGVTYIWSSFPGCVGRGVEINCTPSTPGPQYVFVSVNDTVGASRLSPGQEVQIYGALAVALVPGQVLADEGTLFSIRAEVSGGAYPLQYAWSGLPAGCSSTGPLANCSLPDASNYEVGVQVTDSAHAVVSATSIEVLGHAKPAVLVAASAETIAAEGTVTFTATTAGGAAPFAFRWSGLPDGCSTPTTATVTCTPTLVGNYSVTVAATDQANQTVRNSTSVTVAGNTTLPPPSPSGPSSNSALLPEILVLIAAVVAVALIALWARRRYR